MKIRDLIFVTLVLWAAATPLRAQDPGTLRWSVTTGDSVYSSPAVDGDGTLYAGSYDGKLYALTPAGTQKWVFATSGQISSSPAIGWDGTVYFGGTDSKFYALNRNGSLKWSFAAGGSIYLSSPALGLDGTVYIGCLDRKLYALRPDGTKKWEYATGGEIYSSPAIGDDGTLYIASRDQKLYALNPDGTKKWDFTGAAAMDSSPVIGPQGEIYVSSGNNFYALNSTGSNIWQYAAGGAIRSSPAVRADGVLYFGSDDGVFHALNPDGSKQWDLVTTNAFQYSSPALGADGLIYTAAMNNKLFAINSDGTLKWTFKAPDTVAFSETYRYWTYSSPAIGPDGIIYIGCNNARLYAINGTKGLASAPWPMFRRDLRHSGAGFVSRRLPDGYSPGVMLKVTLTAAPPAAGTYYYVEDQMPSGWTVGAINNNGVFDAANRKVRFGPFFDAIPRTFTYEVTPPQSDRGLKVFGGGATVNSWDSLIGGQSSLSVIPTQPADNQPIDFRLTITELTAYGKAWKSGNSWPTPPSPIPVNYLAGASEIWRMGEYYGYSTNTPGSFYWISATNQAPSVLPDPTAIVLNNATMIAAMPISFTSGLALTVQILVTPPTNTAVYAIEDQPPAGWIVGPVSGGGRYDDLNRTVKWGPFFDDISRSFSYEVIPAASSGEVEMFTGLASFDGITLPIGGQREITSGGDYLPAAQRKLPLAYVPGKTLTVTLQVLAPSDGIGCVVADRPPTGWTVGAISANGVWDGANRLVKFAVFPNADDVPQVLTYQVTPPAAEASGKWFVGSVSLNGFLETVQGDSLLALSTLFPADVDPVDGRIDIQEMVAYYSAWLQNGGSWLMAPSPIQMGYLTRAMMLWRGGEAYRHDETIHSPPLDWVNTTPPSPFEIVPPATGNTGLGVAFTLGPLEYPLGVPSMVTIQVISANSTRVYAVEDQPPTGWLVSQISDNGLFDEANHKVKWGPFFGDAGRILSYWVTPSQSLASTNNLVGVVAFNGGTIPIDHQYQFTLPLLSVRRYSPVDGLFLQLSSPIGRVYQIQSSADLVKWNWILDVTNVDGILQLNDPNAAKNERQFYRAYAP
jgi:outer membrane protein assembly factor BamB